MTREKTESRIRKLLALAQNNPSVEEAAVAFAKAQELAALHALDLDDLAEAREPETIGEAREVEKISQRVIATFKRCPLWLLNLADRIASVNRCRVYYQSGDEGGITAYGQPSDLNTVDYMFQAIRREIDRLANAAAKGRGRSWGRNFRLGAVDEIGRRLREAKQRAIQGAKEDAFKVGGETALVRVSTALQHEEEVAAAVEHYHDHVLDLGRGSGFQGAGSYGYGEGRRAGKGVSIGGGRALGKGKPRALK